MCDMDRRLKTVTITGEMVPYLLSPARQDWQIVEGVPADADLDGAYYDMLYHRLVLRFRHPSFEEVPENGVVPELSVTVRAILPDAVVGG